MQHVSFSNFYNKHKINLTRTFQLLFLLQKLIEISSFVFFTNRRNLCLWSSGKLVIIAKVFLKLPNLLMLKRPKSVTSQKLGSLVTFGKSLIVISTKVNLPYLYLVVLVCYLYLTSGKAKLFTEIFLKNSNLDDSGISLWKFSF